MSKILTYKQYYTPTEANQLLTELLEPLHQAKELLLTARTVRVELETARNDEQRSDAYCRLEEHKCELNFILGTFRRLNIEVKGLDPPLLNFPALRNGQEVFLSWRDGETEVSTWHPRNAGLTGRMKLEPGNQGCFEWCN